jgi:hypothetical protein
MSRRPTALLASANIADRIEIKQRLICSIRLEI